MRLALTIAAVAGCSGPALERPPNEPTTPVRAAPNAAAPHAGVADAGAEESPLLTGTHELVPEGAYEPLPKTVRVEKIDVSGDIYAAWILKSLQGRGRAFHECFAPLLIADPELSVQLQVTFEIDASGNVGSISVDFRPPGRHPKRAFGPYAGE